MRRMRAALVLTLVAGCLDGPGLFTGPLSGTWGGDDAGLIVTDSTAHVHIGCNSGDAPLPITADSTGQFSANGTYTVGAYPVGPGTTHPAHFTGQINGRTMVLTVTLTDTTGTFGPVTLTYGKTPQMGPCPICRNPKARRIIDR